VSKEEHGWEKKLYGEKAKKFELSGEGMNTKAFSSPTPQQIYQEKRKQD